MSEYLQFLPAPIAPDRKTKIVDVVALRSGERLGQIKWFGRWRQYAFFPNAATIWNPQCLDAVNAEIARLMNERRS